MHKRLRRKPSGTPTIYFIATQDRQAIKIGYSGNVADRLATLQTGSPIPLVLVATMPGTQTQEQRLHAQFDRINGEWFRPTSKLIRYIVDHAETTPAFYEPPPAVSGPVPAPPARPARPAPAPRQWTRPPFFVIVYRTAYVEVLALSFIGAALSLYDVIMPRLIVLTGIPESVRMWAVLVLCFVSILALSHRYARGGARPAPAPPGGNKAQRPHVIMDASRGM